ncbi:MAG TPA: class I SAM-dependent methyltransferase [Cyclobacteriaceae bacterium]
MNPDSSVAKLAGFRDYFSRHPSFRHREGLFHQSGIAYEAFEREYTALRTSEGRLLPDAIVKDLPHVPRQHPLRKEWLVRKRSAEALARYMKKTSPARVLEIGCGNGWLINFLAGQVEADYCGVDVNEIELKQAVRLFSTQDRITFVYGDITSSAFDECKTDVIVCASVIQYFPDLPSLLDRLKGMLCANGEIHIIDSPLYREGDAAAAKARSVDHFWKTGQPDMASYYHHHTWKSLKNDHYDVLHHPNSLSGRIKKWLGYSPFPWVVVRLEE